MFGLFNKSKKNKMPPLIDLEGNPLKTGDLVMSYRYDLGKCLIVQEDENYYYQSVGSEEKVHWLKMVDAATENQKVRKIEE